VVGASLKKCPGGSFDTATEARPTRHGDDKPGHSRSGRRAGSVFLAHWIRWGRVLKVPGDDSRFSRHMPILARRAPELAKFAKFQLKLDSSGRNFTRRSNRVGIRRQLPC
jgi:hypothetical protein